ncbi:MAG: hypothetical protein CME68_04975 [Halobacteriovoraceae bacterium]|nr:hypothetical protein [Halobacteriovoraceae bacterium]
MNSSQSSNENSKNKNVIKIPDFRKYITKKKIKDISFHSSGVHITWSDDITYSYNRFWLRENATDPETTHPDSREQLLNLLNIPDNLSILSAEITKSGSMRIVWAPLNYESFYDPSWLRFWGENRLKKNVGLPDTKLWKNFSSHDFPTVNLLEDKQEESLLKWLHHLKVYGLSVLRGIGDTTKDLEKVLEAFGIIKESNFGKVFNVKFEEEPISNAYTNIELPLHGDLCTRQFMPKYQFLHCLENSSEAGESLLADGFMLAEILKETEPLAFKALTEINVHFINKAESSDYQWVEKVIILDKSGKVVEIRMSPWLRGPVCGTEEEEEMFYKAFRTFMRLAQKNELQEKIKLQTGDLLAFDNTRVLHGRNAIGKGGKRWLRGCYMDSDDVDSALRMGRIPRLP